MWIGLFIVAVTAAISFGVAAIILQFGNEDRSVMHAKLGAELPKTKILLPNLPALGSQNPILLTGRMKALRLDPAEVARFEPVVLRELSIRCRACKSAAQCAADLAHHSNDELDWEWRDYCPNAPTLNMISVVRDCHLAFMNSEGAVSIT